jgi:hypothetical protein
MNHKTFNSSKIWLTGVTLALLFTVFGCKKEDKGELATITTTAVTEVRATTASSGGLITANGGTTITARGVCWSTSPSPTVHSRQANSCKSLIMSDDSYFSPRSFGEQGSLL